MQYNCTSPVNRVVLRNRKLGVVKVSHNESTSIETRVCCHAVSVPRPFTASALALHAPNPSPLLKRVKAQAGRRARVVWRGLAANAQPSIPKRKRLHKRMTTETAVQQQAASAHKPSPPDLRSVLGITLFKYRQATQRGAAHAALTRARGS